MQVLKNGLVTNILENIIFLIPHQVVGMTKGVQILTDTFSFLSELFL